MRAWVARVGHATNWEQVGREPQHTRDGVALGWGNNEDREGGDHGGNRSKGAITNGRCGTGPLGVAAKHNMVGSAKVAKMAAKLAKTPTHWEWV